MTDTDNKEELRWSWTHVKEDIPATVETEKFLSKPTTCRICGKVFPCGSPYGFDHLTIFGDDPLCSIQCAITHSLRKAAMLTEVDKKSEFERLCSERAQQMKPKIRHSKIDPTSCCTILQTHHEALKDDPERLSTEFIQKMSRCRCSKVE